MTSDGPAASSAARAASWHPSRADLITAGLILTAALFFWLQAHDTMGAAVALKTAAGRTPSLKDYTATGLFYGILAGLGALLVLALSRKLWAAPLDKGPVPLAPHLARNFFMPLLAIALLAGALRFPRLSTSLYADEAYTLQNYVMGKFDIRKAWPPEFEPAGWNQTFFGNKEANNHILFSVAGRACLDLWRSLAGAERHAFNETAFRLPSFLAGTASVPLLALLLAMAGLPRSGLAAGFLLALHPWHIRYSGEARGYAFTIFFILLGLLFLQLASRRGEWKHLAGYAACQFAALASFPGALHLLLPLGIGTLLWFWLTPAAPRPRWAMAARLAAANLMAAIPFAVLYGPSLPQIARYLALDRAKGGINGAWLANEWGLFTLGMPWRSDNPANPLLVSVSSTPGLAGWLALLLAVSILPLLFVWGLRRLAVAGGAALLLGAGSAASVLISILHSALTGALLYPWYLIHALPGFVAAIAAGIEGPGVALSRTLRLPAASRVWTGLMVLAFALATQNPRVVHMNFSREQNREAAVAARGGAQPGTPEAQKVLAATVWSDAPLYDPTLRWTPKPDDLVPLIRQAIAEGRPLFFTYRNRAGAEATVPDLLKILDDRRIFDFVRDIPGTDEQQFTHYVLSLRRDLTPEILDERLAALGLAAPAASTAE